jgi:hypothetical protein
MLLSVGLGRTDRRRASRAALGADYRCPLTSLVALLTWRDLLFFAKHLFVAAKIVSRTRRLGDGQRAFVVIESNGDECRRDADRRRRVIVTEDNS